VKNANAYTKIIEHIFLAHHRPGVREFAFEREEVATAAKRTKTPLPKNIGDLIYTFRYRAAMPPSIAATAGKGEQWIIRSVGRSRYQFSLVKEVRLAPSSMTHVTKVPDATPGVIRRYPLSDEQALPAILRYNRLIDLFLREVCYSLQGHRRASVKGLGQIETDELYVGVDPSGAHSVIPEQAKGGKDRLSVVQIEQDLAMCAEVFPALACRPVAAQFMRGDVIALFELGVQDGAVVKVQERHYQLVQPGALSDEELAQYRRLSQP
jgi:hypothetical protein